MRKFIFVFAVIAASSSMTFAAEVKQTKTAAPVVKATTMSDAQMDKVTAGAALNIFEDASTNPPTILKETGSQLHGNSGAVLGGNGTLNQNHHFPF